MKYVLYGITAAFAVLSLIAAASKLKTAEHKNSHIIMSLGGLILIAGIGFHIIYLPYNWIAAVIGGALICAAAVYNGRKSGEFHITHHLVRIAVTLIIIAGFIFIET